jgi:hypothetical protein
MTVPSVFALGFLAIIISTCDAKVLTYCQCYGDVSSEIYDVGDFCLAARRDVPIEARRVWAPFFNSTNVDQLLI